MLTMASELNSIYTNKMKPKAKALAASIQNTRIGPASRSLFLILYEAKMLYG